MAVATSEALGSSFKISPFRLRYVHRNVRFQKEPQADVRYCPKMPPKVQGRKRGNADRKQWQKAFTAERRTKRCCDEGLTRAREEKKSGAKKDQGLNCGALNASTPSDHHRNPIFPPTTNFLDWDLGRPIGGSLQERSGNIV